MLVELSFYGVWPASSCTWGECFPVDHSVYQVSLLLWLMELCRMSDISFYLESVCDEKWHACTGQLDPRFVRLWIPIDDQMRLCQFLQQASISLTAAAQPEPQDGRKRKAPQQAVYEDDDEIEISHRLISSKFALIKAMMHNFMGLRSKSVSDLDLDVPADDTPFSPLSPMRVWSAEAMFADSLYQNRWRRERVAGWQTRYENYVTDDGQFIMPDIARQRPGVMRQLIPGVPWMDDRSKNGIDAIRVMAMPHITPKRIKVEDKMRENARASGNSVGPFHNLSDSEFWGMFSTDGDDLSADAELIDPVNFSPIEYRPMCSSQEYNTDTTIMEELYPTVMMMKSDHVARKATIEQLILDVDDAADFGDHVRGIVAEVDIVNERIAHACEIQMQSPCDGVPLSFSKVYNELVNKLFPSMRRSKDTNDAAWELFHMEYAFASRDSALTEHALITTQKVEMAASADGLDLAQPQIMVWKVLYDGTMALLRLRWNQLQLAVSSTGPTQKGKSEAGVAALASVADSLASTCDGQSAKSVYLTGDIALRVIDERTQQANDRSPETLLLQTTLQKGVHMYEQYDLVAPAHKKSKRRTKSKQPKDRLKKILSDKRQVTYFCGNFRAATAVETRCINVAWAGDDGGGTSRQLGERVNADRSKRPATLLCLKLWSALSVIPHVLEANGGVTGVDEGMVTVFFALYDLVMVRSHGKKVIKPRNMRHVVTVATGIMIERLLTKVYRRSDAPWDVPITDCLYAMRDGGYVISMEDILSAYLNILKTEDGRKPRAQVLGGLKSLIDFELDNHPRQSPNKQYYILRADKKNIHETLREIIPAAGEGLIQTYIDRFLQEKDRVTGERVLQEARDGKLHILCSVVDAPGIVSAAEIALQSLLRVIRDEEFCAEPGELPEPKYSWISFDENSLLLSRPCVLQFTEGQSGPYAERFSGLKDTYVQGIYFWTQKGFVKNHRNPTGPQDPSHFPECLALVDAPQHGFVPCKSGGMFDYRKRNHSGQSDGFLAYKMPFARPCELEIKLEILDEMYEQRKIFEADSVEEPTRELIDVCMHVSGEANPGQKVFLGLSNQCDGLTLPARTHTVRLPPKNTYTILNPDRGSKMSSMRHKGPAPLLGYDTHVALNGTSYLYRNLVDAFRSRNLMLE